LTRSRTRPGVYSELYARIRWARKVLPPLVGGIVVALEWWLHLLPPDPWLFYLQIVFYGVVGPLVIWLTLDWVSEEVRERAEAEAKLLEANQRLRALREVLSRSLATENLEEVIRGVVNALADVLGADASLELEGYHWSTPSFYTRRGLPVQRLELVRSGGRLELILPDGESDAEFLDLLAAEVDSLLEAAKARTRDFLTLFEVDEAMGAEANLEKLLAGLLSKIIDWAGAKGGVVYLLDADGILHPWAEVHLPEARHSFAPSGRWEEAKRAPTFVEPNLLAIPLYDKDPVGVLVLRGNARHLKEEMPFLRLLARQVALAVRNAQAYLRAEELAINEERNRIAREIHDGIAQALAFMALKLDLATRLLDRDPGRAKQEIGQVKETLRGQIREVRRSIFALRPIDLERYGLVQSIERYARAFAEQVGLSIGLELADDVGLTPASEVVLFRVLQEALNNVAKHARAGGVRVRLKALGEKGARLEICDDGVGFDPDQPLSAGLGGFGMAQMRERVEARGGRFEVRSTPGEGTCVNAELPY